jgi:group I intron endonuclease
MAKYPISNKYLNHGKSVPIRKCSKFKFIPLNYKVSTHIRTYCTLPNTDSIPAKVYEDAYSMKNIIIKENTGKSGIYMLTNKLTGDIYVGQSSDISNRFKNYFNLSYLKSKNGFRISRALIKYGYSNFSLIILEYCNKSDLLEREQYYFDKLEPQYNILKIAGSSEGFNHSEETKAKISKALKGIYIGEKSALFGRLHREETKQLMSLKKAGENNPLYGKFHSPRGKEETKNLMKQKALGRKHSDETKLKMSAKKGNPVNIYEKCSSEEFKLIGSFISARRAGKFLEMSGSTVIKYMNSGAIYKYRYKFSSQ